MKFPFDWTTAATRRSVCALGLSLSFGGCAGTVVPDTNPGLESAQAAGAEIWAVTCNRCHNLRPPQEYRAEDWPIIVNHMRTRVGLTKSEARAVTAFLQQLAPESTAGS